MSVVSNWIDALQSNNIPEGTSPDPIAKWLVLTRASVFPMTFFSAAIKPRVLVGLCLYLALIWVHPYVLGVHPIP